MTTKTLAIETSCDDTSLAVVSYDGKVFNCDDMKAYSQVADHQEYGGVVPEIASRQHSEKILKVYDALTIDWESIDTISVTVEPGLPGSLLIGKSLASSLSAHFNKPLIKVNHIHGHIVSFLLERDHHTIQFPIVVLSVSGGHNDLYLLSDKVISCDHEEQRIGSFFVYKLGWTIDDASGEAFDKVSRMLSGPYPGGPWISQQAALHDPENDSLTYTIPYINNSNLLFSFSGLKSQVYYTLDAMKKRGEEITQQSITSIAYAFQEAACGALQTKAIRAAQLYDAKGIALVGGVSANRRLRAGFEKNFDGTFYTPTQFAYCTDNAAMIGTAGILGFSQ